jgi:WD40 repeat protein
LITLKEHSWSVVALAFSPDGLILASGSIDGKIQLWDLGRKNPAEAGLSLNAHTDAVNALAISEDSKFLVSGSRDRSIKIWSL